MSPYEIYIFVLCFIVFSLFTVLFSTLLYYLVSLTLKLIRNGLEDEKIRQEYESAKTRSRVVDIICRILSGIICLALIIAFSFSLYLRITEPTNPNGVPSLKVVKSGSMAYANEKNTYLTENGVTDQIQMFDMILTHRLPAENELKLYDIVLYDMDGFPVIHRIIDIEEPCAAHPDERWFTTRGDANRLSDQYPVLYNQMRGIYRGERIPFVGSFVMFMQSPAGWLCVLLVVVSMIATPMMDKKLRLAKEERLRFMGILPSPEEGEDGHDA